MSNKIEDINALDINALIKYVMWSRDKIAGGVSQENAVKALSRLIDYDINLMKSISGKTDDNS
jgi:hypothetical protein